MKMKKSLISLLIGLSLVGGSVPIASAKTTHTYHAEAISKSFEDSDSDMPELNKKVDAYVDSISNLQDYNVSYNTTDYLDDSRISKAIETVHLTRKHQSTTDKILTEIDNDIKALRNL